MAETLFDKLGGAPVVRVAVDRFYERVTGDPQVAHYFEGIDLPALRRHQALFLTWALNGPARGDWDLYEAHKGRGITGADYDCVVEHLVSVLREASAPGEVIDALGEAVAGLRPVIVAR